MTLQYLSEDLYGNKDRLYRQHCLPHKLNLAGRELADKIPALQKFENDIKGIAKVTAQNAKYSAYMMELARVNNANFEDILGQHVNKV